MEGKATRVATAAAHASNIIIWLLDWNKYWEGQTNNYRINRDTYTDAAAQLAVQFKVYIIIVLITY